MSALAPTLQSFFAEYLSGQRAASRHTVAAYRDTFRLLLGYVHEQTGVRPTKVDFAMLDAELIARFLAMLEQRRATPPEPATRAWPLSIPCSPTPRYATLNTPT